MGRIAAASSVFHAIADPTRRAILDLLRQEADESRRTVLAMLHRLARLCGGLTQSAFSQHLKVLLSAGLVTAEKRGRLRIYALRPKPLEEVADWITAYDAFWTDKLDNLGRYLQATHGPRAAASPAPNSPSRREGAGGRVRPSRPKKR